MLRHELPVARFRILNPPSSTTFSAGNSSPKITIDVTDAVNAALAGRLGTSGSLSFMIARTFRRNGSGSGSNQVLPDVLGVNQAVRLSLYPSPPFPLLNYFILSYLSIDCE